MKTKVLPSILLGLVAGGMCGAAVGLGMVSPFVGVGGAVVVAVAVGLLVARAKKRPVANPGGQAPTQ